MVGVDQSATKVIKLRLDQSGPIYTSSTSSPSPMEWDSTRRRAIVTLFDMKAFAPMFNADALQYSEEDAIGGSQDGSSTIFGTGFNFLTVIVVLAAQKAVASSTIF
jgi:hypothetical protein